MKKGKEKEEKKKGGGGGGREDDDTIMYSYYYTFPVLSQVRNHLNFPNGIFVVFVTICYNCGGSMSC